MPPASEPPSSPPPDPTTRRGFFTRHSLKSPNEALQPEAAPQPPPSKKKRRGGALSAFSGVLAFLLVLWLAGAFGLVAMQRKRREPGPLAADKVVYIAPGTDAPDIIATLEKE